MLKNPRLRKRFFKSFLFTVLAGLVIIGATLLLLRMLISSPTVPVHAEMPFLPNLPGPTTSPQGDAFDTVEPHPDDALLRPSIPEGWARRDNFWTLLIFGYDEGLNTDTIMVAAFDVDNESAYLVSIPRDTRIDVRRNVRRINSAYPVGRIVGGGHDGGVEQLRREVQTLIGFMPDFYVSVQDAAFERIVDAVGGVYIDVPFHMRYDDPFQGLSINIPAGRQRLDGRNALHFVRYRYGNNRQLTISDDRRMGHQQQLIAAMMDELLTPRVVLRIPELLSTYRDHVSTDLSLSDMLWFAEQFITGNITLHSYVYPTTSRRISHWYEIPNEQEALELINRTINPFNQDITSANLQLSR